MNSKILILFGLLLAMPPLLTLRIDMLSSTKDRLEYLEDQLIIAHLDIDRLKIDNDFIKSEVSDLKHEDHVKSEQIYNLQSQINGQSSDYKQVIAEIAALKDERLKDKQKLDALEINYGLIMKENEAIKIELITLKVENGQQNTAISGLNADLDLLRNENTQQNTAISDLDSKLALLKVENNQQNTDIFDLATANGEIKNSVASLVSKTVQIDQQIEQLTGQNSQLISEMGLLRNQIESLSSSSQQDRSRIQVIENEIANTKGQMATLNQNIEGSLFFIN